MEDNPIYFCSRTNIFETAIDIEKDQVQTFKSGISLITVGGWIYLSLVSVLLAQLNLIAVRVRIFWSKFYWEHDHLNFLYR